MTPNGSEREIGASERSPRVVETRVSSGLLAGATAGAASTAVFTVLHQIFISAIWWMFPVMLVAGAVCGACLAWCYSELVPGPSPRSWAWFTAMWTVMFGLLALASSAFYEPIITMAEMLESTGGNPIPISETLGLMIPFTLAWAGLVTWRYGAGWRGFGVVVASTTVLMLLLGFNVSTMGLVEIPTEGWVLVAKFFGYLAALGGVFGLVYALVVRWPKGAGVPDAVGAQKS